MKTDYCAYPPELADDVEITEQRDGDRLAFIAGSASVGRYLLLREAEHRVLSLLGESLPPAAVCEEFKRRHGGTLPLATLIKFLKRLDEIGLLAGERAEDRRPPEQQQGTQFYTRFKLFNPEPLFTQLVARLRWVWTIGFFAGSLTLMFAALLLAMMNWTEVARYGAYALRQHYVAIIVAGLFVGITHEFAHGLTCKAFGGRTTEVGVLMIYYFLPALYCNVSGIHVIPKRGRRLWVIAAGVYWQLLVGTAALLAWFLLAPYTLAADVAFVFFCGSVLDVAFNANPLIKLDGYYFLSQFLRMPNLMDRSRAWWRGLLLRIVFGKPDAEAARFSKREQMNFAVFGALSFGYTVALMLLIVTYLGAYLIDWFHLSGLLMTIGLALFYIRRPLKQSIAKVVHTLIGTAVSVKQLFTMRTEGKMATQDQTTKAASSGNAGEATGGQKADHTDPRQSPRWRRRRRLVPLAITLSIGVVLCLPWRASIGAYSTLIAVPGREATIRAPESATLLALRVEPGAEVASGAVIGQMGDLTLEEDLVKVQAELARANGDWDRLMGELRVYTENVARAETQLRQRSHEYEENDVEQHQIDERRRAKPSLAGEKYLLASTVPTGFSSADRDSAAILYPAAVAVLQSDVDLRRARLEEAGTQLDRARQLYAQGITPRSELDATEMRASTSGIELAGARERLEAALVEHRRRHMSSATEMQLARSDVGAAALHAEKLGGELRAMRELIAAIENRRDLLRRKQAQFELVTPLEGRVFGEYPAHLIGQHFQKGSEICRVADTSQMLVRIQVAEREIGDVRVGRAVRLKTPAHPDITFRGTVAKIGGESELDQNNQATYRVELVVENADGLLRPGMSAFARIDFDRQMIWRILLHKVKRAMRPELWML